MLYQGNALHEERHFVRMHSADYPARIWPGIASMMAASLLWTLMLASSEMAELGLTRIDREDGTWLVLDPTKTRLRTCTMGGRSVTCIKIEEN